MQVEWNTVELLAQTKAVDLWYLLSTGYRSPATSYAHRRDGGSLKKRLDALFGTPEWRTMFYEVTTMTGLFGDFEMQRRTATAEQIRNFCRRGSLSDSPALLMALYWRIPATVHCICYVSPLPMSAEPSLQLRLRRRF
jgi:hypothetical protein